MASIVGTAFVPKELLWIPSTELSLPVASSGALLTLDAIVFEAARRLERRISLPVVKEQNGLLIGQRGMTHQYGVDFIAPDKMTADGLDAERYIEPAVASLANSIGSCKWKNFGELQLPSGVDRAVRATSGKVSLRGIMDYDFDRGYLLRLDVIGG